MKKSMFVPATVVALFVAVNAAIASADEKKEGAKPKAASVEEQMDNLVQQGPGVHNIKKDDQGRVKSLVVVGQVRISTVFGAAEGKQRARKKAEQSAKAEFMKWLKESVDVCENANNETIVLLQGKEGTDKDAHSETGKKLEVDSDSYKSVTSGMVRGLELLHSDINAEEKTCTLIYGWSLANSKAAKHTATHDPGIKEKRRAAAEPAETESSPSDTSDKEIHSKKATSKEAEDYLK